MLLLLHKMSKENKIIVIVGPTASGKSNLGVFLAKKIKGEIISADSRQIYKNLNVGSGKITKKEMGGIPHYCLDIANPKKIFTAYDYKKSAQKAMQKIWKAGKTPIIVGGTGFYIDVAIGRVELSNVPPNPKLRKRLSKYSTLKLFSILKKLDPKKSKNIDKNNPVRLIRAIEIINGLTSAASPLILARPAAGSEASRFFASPSARTLPKKPKKPFRGSLVNPQNIFWIGINRPGENLKKRIHKRLIARLPRIIKEIKKLRNPPAGGGVSWKRLFDLGLEYRYVSLCLQNKLSKNDMIKTLESEINKYAKRQMTYFKRNKEIHWVSSKKEAKKLGQQFLLAR